MKEVFEQYAAYNVWANQKIIDVILALPEEKVNKTITSSFSSLRLTLLHLWTTESTWWQRLKLVEHIGIIGNSDSLIQEIATGLITQSKQWKEWIEKSTVAALEHEFIYRNSKKQQFKQPVYMVLLHLFNHGTYHRGQMVTMLRQAGVESIPATDFIVFSRKEN